MKSFTVIFVIMTLTLTLDGAVFSEEMISVKHVNASSVLLFENNTGRILFARDTETSRPIASLTKLMTLLLTAEAVESGDILLQDRVKTSRHASLMGGSQIFLKEGEKMTVDELAYSTAMMSANDAAVALGEYIAGSESAFVEMMNRRAAELGMKSTKYTSANGLPPGRREHREYDRSSASDLGRLAVEIVRHPLILTWTSRWLGYLRGGEFMLYNTNKLLKKVDGMDGLKTGFTWKAGFCYVGSAVRNGRRLTVVILNAESQKARFNLASRLLDSGFAALNQSTNDSSSVRKACSEEKVAPELPGLPRPAAGKMDTLSVVSISRG